MLGLFKRKRKGVVINVDFSKKKKATQPTHYLVESDKGPTKIQVGEYVFTAELTPADIPGKYVLTMNEENKQ
jgi:hypothetical protein